MSGSASKRKGTRAEREFAELMGGKRVPGSGALPGLPADVRLDSPFDSMLWEVKARAALPRIIHEALVQAAAAKSHHGSLQFPAAAIRGDRQPFVVVMYAKDFRDWGRALADVGHSQRIKENLRAIERAVGDIKAVV